MYKCVQLCVDNSYFMLNFQHDGGGGVVWQLNEHKNLHFDEE